MANYYGKTRTNYFNVTDEEKFRSIIDECVGGEDTVQVIENDKGQFGFMCEDSISGYLVVCTADERDREQCEYRLKGECEECNCDYDFDAFLSALKEILPDNEAIILTEVGSEKMRYLNAYSVVITNKGIDSIRLDDQSLRMAERLLGVDNFRTQMDY